MPTLTITFNFATDNGDAELFVNGSSADFTEGAYDGSEGSPVGSVYFATAWTPPEAYDSFQEKRINQSYEDWGIPAGSSITSVAIKQRIQSAPYY